MERDYDAPDKVQRDGSAALTGWPYTANAADPVNHPPHYTQGGIECIDAIEAALTPDEFRGYCKGNAFKYTWRERHKGAGNTDISKAVFYLKRIK